MGMGATSRTMDDPGGGFGLFLFAFLTVAACGSARSIMALVETQMVSTQDVFLPCAVMGDGKTLAERVRRSPQFLLGDRRSGIGGMQGNEDQ